MYLVNYEQWTAKPPVSKPLPNQDKKINVKCS